MKKMWIFAISFLFIAAPGLAKSPQEIAALAEEVTLQINSYKQIGGSGVIIAKKDDTYTVLTAHHVVILQNLDYTVRTSKGKVYPAEVVYLRQEISDPDLALLTFKSKEKYTVVDIGESSKLKPGSDIFIAGFPGNNEKGEDRAFAFAEGSIVGFRPKAAQGYTLRYDAKTVTGMSGGPVLNSNGALVGIHGQKEAEIVFNPNPSKDITIDAGFNAGIPISQYFSLLKSRRSSPTVATLPPHEAPGSGTRQTKVQPPVAVPSAPPNKPPDLSQVPQPLEPSPETAPKSAKSEEPAPPPPTPFKQALINIDRGLYGQAIAMLSEILDKDPNNLEALLYRGSAYFQQDNQINALEDFNKILAINPKMANVLFNRGIIFFEMAKAYKVKQVSTKEKEYEQKAEESFSKALQDFEEAATLSPDFRIFYAIGITKRHINDRLGAIEALTKTTDLRPTFVDAYVNRAIIRRFTGQLSEAISDLDKAIEINSTYARAIYHRGLFRRDNKDPQGGLMDLEKAADLFKAQEETENYNKAVDAIDRLKKSGRLNSTE